MKPTSKEVIDELCKILNATPKEIKGFMTPKEKAKSLVGRMERSKDMPYQYAKQCALIAVDEIIDVLVDLSFGEFTFINDVVYWQEVKQEIEKL